MGSPKKILVCTKGKHCPKKDSDLLFRALKQTVSACQLKGEIKIKKSECFGLCEHGPIVMVAQDGLSYGGVTGLDCLEIVERHARKRKAIKRLLVAKAGKKHRKK